MSILWFLGEIPGKLEDGQGKATEDNKHNLARREQYYATVRKLPPSPAHLECIPGMADTF